jgi:hypothetical protein
MALVLNFADFNLSTLWTYPHPSTPEYDTRTFANRLGAVFAVVTAFPPRLADIITTNIVVLFAQIYANRT